MRRDCTGVIAKMEIELWATPKVTPMTPLSTLLTSGESVARLRGAAPAAAGRMRVTAIAAGEALGAGEFDGVGLVEAPALDVGVGVTLVLPVPERLTWAVADGKMVRVPVAEALGVGD